MEPPSDTKIFVDSNYFISLFNPVDGNYVGAVALFHALEREHMLLVTSNFVFAEVVTVLSQRQNRPSAIVAGSHLQANPRIRIIHIDEALHRTSWQVFQEIQKKNMSFVDCSILAVMHAEHITKLLTFDRTDFAPMRQRYHFKFYEEK